MKMSKFEKFKQNLNETVNIKKLLGGWDLKPYSSGSQPF